MAIAMQANEPSRYLPKRPGPNKQVHTPNTKYGMGDYYGSGVKAKIGKMIEGTGMQNMSPRKIRTPPKSLA